MRLSTQFLLSWILLGAISGEALAQSCKGVFSDSCVLASFDISNSSGEDATVYLRVASKSDDTIWTHEVKIPKGQAKLFDSEKFSAAKDTKLTWQYSVASLDARFDLPPREIRNTPGRQSFTQSLREIERYNDATAGATIAKISSDLKLQTIATPLKNAERELGTVWIGNADGSMKGASWHLKDIEIVASSVLKLEKKISIKGSTATNTAANLPLLSSITANLEQTSIYWMEWKAEHFGFDNTNLEADMFAEASPAKLRSMLAAMESSKDRHLCYISRAHVIKFLSHTVTKGRRQSAAASASYTTLFAADGSYVFDAQDSQLSTMTDQLVDRKFNCIPVDQAILQAKARQGELEPSTSKPASPTQ